MQSKYTVGAIGNCPTLDQLEAAFTTWGFPPDQKYGLIEIHKGPDNIEATLCVSGTVTVKHVDADSKAVEEQTVPKTVMIPFRIVPSGTTKPSRLEAFYGRGAIKHISKMFKVIYEQNEENAKQESDDPIVVEKVAVDMLNIFEAVQKANTKRGGATLVSAKVTRQDVDGKMQGAYSPKFAASPDGVDYVKANFQVIKSIDVLIAFTNGKVRLTICPEASFVFSAGEDDVEGIRFMLEDSFQLPDKVGGLTEEVAEALTEAGAA